MNAQLKTIGASGQISLGKQHAGRQVLVEEQEDGVWLVRTAQVIPDNERWLHTTEAKAALTKAFAWAATHDTAEATDLDAFFQSIEDSVDEKEKALGKTRSSKRAQRPGRRQSELSHAARKP